MVNIIITIICMCLLTKRTEETGSEACYVVHKHTVVGDTLADLQKQHTHQLYKLRHKQSRTTKDVSQ